MLGWRFADAGFRLLEDRLDTALLAKARTGFPSLFAFAAMTLFWRRDGLRSVFLDFVAVVWADLAAIEFLTSSTEALADEISFPRGFSMAEYWDWTSPSSFSTLVNRLIAFFDFIVAPDLHGFAIRRSDATPRPCKPIHLSLLLVGAQGKPFVSVNQMQNLHGRPNSGLSRTVFSFTETLIGKGC